MQRFSYLDILTRYQYWIDITIFIHKGRFFDTIRYPCIYLYTGPNISFDLPFASL